MIDIRPQNVLGVIKPGLAGVNVAVWDGELGAAERPSQLQRVGITSLRYPGGSMSDDYHWATNRVDGRTHTEPSPSPVFARLTETIGATALVTVNYGSGTPQEAAAWVAWANGSPLSLQPIGVDARGLNWKTVGYWATLRATPPLPLDDGNNLLRAGHAAPYRWRYFEIGNEIFGSWETDRHGEPGSGLSGKPHDPGSYAVNAAEFIRQMKAVDSSIKVGVVGYHGEPYDERKADDRCLAVCDPALAVPDRAGIPHYGWTPVVIKGLSRAGVRPDFIVHHVYPQLPGRENDARLLQSAPQLKEHAATLRRQIAEYWEGADGDQIEIGLTEFNTVTGNPGKQSISLVGALYFADAYGQLAASQIDFAHWWTLTAGINLEGNQSADLHGSAPYGSYGWLSNGAVIGGVTPPPAHTPFPPFRVAQMMAPWHAPGAVLVESASSDSALSVYTSRHADGHLSLLVINKYPDRLLTAQVRVADFKPTSGAVETLTYGIGEERIGGQARQGRFEADASGFSYDFEPYSATLLTLR